MMVESSPSEKISLKLFVFFFFAFVVSFSLIFYFSSTLVFETTQDQLISHVKIQHQLSTKVCFIADAGLNKASEQVLLLMKQEECEIVIHSGDLDYSGFADKFFASIDDILGKNFPYFIAMGNYEAKRGAGRAVAWDAYYKLQRERLKRIPGLRCAVVSPRIIACSLLGVSFITSSLGVNFSRLGLDVRELRQATQKLWGFDDQPVMASSATEFKSTWRFCSWHLPLENFQVGFREGVPWMSSPQMVESYEICRLRGAAIVTGHEHYYVRSHTIKRFDINRVKFENKQTRGVALVNNSTTTATTTTTTTSKLEQISMGPGSSFAVVSGLGGHSVSPMSRSKMSELPHLAVFHPQEAMEDEDPDGKIFYPEITGAQSVSTSNRLERPMPQDGYPFGALICLLQKSGVPRSKGQCYFKTISGQIVDRFNVVRF